jgi:hypothetical protein
MTTKRMTGIVAGLIAGLAIGAGLTLTTSEPARAAIYYPWCAVYSGSDTGGGRNCYFSTHEQCIETIRGNGGICERNGFYDAAPASERAPVGPAGTKRRH